MASAGKRGPVGLAHWLALASLIVLADQFTKVPIFSTWYGCTTAARLSLFWLMHRAGSAGF